MLDDSERVPDIPDDGPMRSTGRDKYHGHKYRRWCFTWNNYTDDNYEHICDYLAQEDLTFAIVGKEVGKEGTPHLQGYINFTNPRSCTGVRRIAPQAHWEKAEADDRANYEYCSKEGDFRVFGKKLPEMKTTKSDWYKKAELTWVIDLIHQDPFTARRRAIEQNPLVWAKYNEFLNQEVRATIQMNYWKPWDGNLKDKNFWLWGEPGVGKTAYVHNQIMQRHLKPYDKLKNKWWDGYYPEVQLVHIEDLDPSCMQFPAQTAMFKQWSDRYHFAGEVKGGCVGIYPKWELWVTSQYPPEKIWPGDDETIKAIRRRFKVIHMTRPFQNLVESQDEDPYEEMLSWTPEAQRLSQEEAKAVLDELESQGQEQSVGTALEWYEKWRQELHPGNPLDALLCTCGILTDKDQVHLLRRYEDRIYDLTGTPDPVEVKWEDRICILYQEIQQFKKEKSAEA